MKLRVSAIHIALGIGLVFAVSGVEAADHFAVATSQTGIYLVRQGGTWSGDQSVIELYNQGTGLSEVAVRGNWVYAADATTGRLVIGKIENGLTSPTLSNVRSIDLGIGKPKSVAIGDNGGVYVAGNESTGGTWKYAYVTADGDNWHDGGTIHVATTAMDSRLDDVASLGSSGGAIIASDKTVDYVPQVTCTTTVNGASTGTTNPVTGTYQPTSPSAITALTGLLGGTPLAYVTSHVGQNQSGLDGLEVYGTLETVNAQTGGVLSSNRLPENFDPWDVATYTQDGKYYLAVIGVPREQEDNNAKVLRIQIDAETGKPIMPSGAGTYYQFTETLGGQKLAVSQDGEVLWSTHVARTGSGATISALNTSDWTTELVDFSSTSSLGIGNVAAYCYVPEPSSLVALAMLATGFAASFRRRRR